MNERKKAVHLKMADLIPVMNWFSTNKDKLLQYTQTELSRMIQKELGISVHSGRIKDFEKQVGVARVRGGNANTRKDRAVILAGELIRLMKTLGVEPSQELDDILKGK